MTIRKLQNDLDLVPKKIGGKKVLPVERSARRTFIYHRVLFLIKHDLTRRLAHPDFPNELDPIYVDSVKLVIQGDIDLARDRFETIWLDVKNHDEHFDLSTIPRHLVRKYRRRGIIRGKQPLSLRRYLVMQLVWGLTGEDPGLLKESKLSTLRLLVDRRLRIVERMLYSVWYLPEAARWSRELMKPIKKNPSGPWRDNYYRLFDYPRVPRFAFGDLCRPNKKGKCLDLDGWWVSSPTMLATSDKVNENADSYWKPLENSSSRFEVKSTADPETAIAKIFEGEITGDDSPNPRGFRDFKSRNLLMCDQVIQALKLEAFVMSRRKRGDPTGWLHQLANTPDKPANWIMIAPAIFADADVLGGAGPSDDFFSAEKVLEKQLQIGDHFVMHAHPAYDNARADSYWRLENAIVIRHNDNKLFVQGHGVNPMPAVKPIRVKKGELKSMKQGMLKRFNTALNRLRTIAIQGESSERLVKRPLGEVAAFHEIPEAVLKANPKTVLRWFLRWDALQDETAEWLHLLALKLYSPPVYEQWIQSVKKNEKIEYTEKYGYFPLWEPQRSKNGSVALNRKGIVKVQPVKVTPDMVAAWQLFFPLDPADRDKTWANRPKEP